MTRETEVLVVGAGPTGLCLSILLRRLGVACLTVDKNDRPSTTSKAIGLQYRVSELLAWMGLVDRFRARAASSAAVHLHVEGATVAVLRLGALADRAGAGAFTPRSIILPQSDTEAILGDALREQDGAVAWGTTFTRFTQGEGVVVSDLAGPGGEERVRSRYLVSCEGAHSVIRKQAGITFAGKAYPHDFVMADVELDWARPHGEAHAFMHPHGVLSTIALPGERRWRLFIEVGDGAPEPGEPTLERVQALLAERTGDLRVRATHPTWLTRFKLHSRMVDRFSAGRVFLAGDAAHLHSPSGGQGITTGMQDAYNLGWKLASVIRQGAPEALLATYGEERLPVAREVLRTTDRNTTRLFARTPLARLWRDRVVLPLLGTSWVQRRMVARLSQLDQGYRGAALAWERRPWSLRRRLRAGDRAPDVLLARVHGEGTSLFALLAGLRFVALVTEGPGAGEAARALGRLGVGAHVVARDAGGAGPDAELVDATGELRRLYGAAGGALWLVRPDGYLGLCCAAADRAVLVAYLAQLWPREAVLRAFDARSSECGPTADGRD